MLMLMTGNCQTAEVQILLGLMRTALGMVVQVSGSLLWLDLVGEANLPWTCGNCYCERGCHQALGGRFFSTSGVYNYEGDIKNFFQQSEYSRNLEEHPGTFAIQALTSAK